MTKDGWNKDVLIAENAMLIECQNAQLEELRQENEQLKKEIKELKEQLDEEIDYKLSYYHDLQEEQKRIAELEKEVLDWKDGSMIVKYEKQLEEKDKKIKSLEQEIENNQRDYVSELAYYTAEENIKQLRHEICEKIRNKLLNSSALVIYHDEDYDRFKEIIDQIEQGE